MEALWAARSFDFDHRMEVGDKSILIFYASSLIGKGHPPGALTALSDTDPCAFTTVEQNSPQMATRTELVVTFIARS
jgi:hypothetical protein